MIDVSYGGTNMALVSAPFAEHDRTGRVGDHLPSMPTACDTGNSRKHVPEPYDGGEPFLGTEQAFHPLENLSAKNRDAAD
jgi:hypothetical protein